MSEYQYYEFQAIDRRLEPREMEELRRYSSRARITPTSFVNEYHFGDFKGNPGTWMETYFDAYLYLANWGTRELHLRIPASLLDIKTARLYCQGECVSAREKSGHLIFTFLSDDEGSGEWIEGDGILSSLLPVRDELAQGDLRALYLGWLLAVQTGETDDASLEPVVPPNLRNLTASLSNFADFLRLDPDLVAVAAEESPRQKPEPHHREAMAAWIAAMPLAEKDHLLMRMMGGGSGQVGRELFARFNRRRTPVAATQQRRRSAGELRAAAQAHEEDRRREQERKAPLEKAKKERFVSIAREKHLDSLSRRIPEMWREIESLIATKQAKNYDLATQHLLDLRDCAKRQGEEADFATRIIALREEHSRKPSFMARLAGFT